MDVDLKAISIVWNIIVLFLATLMVIIIGIVIYRDKKKNPDFKNADQMRQTLFGKNAGPGQNNDKHTQSKKNK